MSVDAVAACDHVQNVNAILFSEISHMSENSDVLGWAHLSLLNLECLVGSDQRRVETHQIRDHWLSVWCLLTRSEV